MEKQSSTSTERSRKCRGKYDQEKYEKFLDKDKLRKQKERQKKKILLKKDPQLLREAREKKKLK